jgi:4-aminobutyrate aminotransferase / (S)-3-amino-2-methylpropionate transaminase / 5-aminovalerate transaminase
MAGHGFSHKPKNIPHIFTDYRTIRTEIPVPESLPLLQKMYDTESRSMHGQMPIIWDRAKGFQVFDPWGNIWIDFSSTIFVANAGHGNERIVEALRNVLDKPLLHTYTYGSPERIDYLEYLIENTPSQFEKAFLLSAGTEAIEAAFKLMRLNGKKNKKKKGGIICFDGAFHGRTLAAQMMTGSEEAKSWIGYHDPEIHHLPFPYPWERGVAAPKEFFQDSLAQLIEGKGLDPDTDLCGFMLETFQGWGAIFYPEEFVKELVNYAHEHGMLVTFDEMQAGFGRTGELFGYMNYGVEPDLLCCGKGASSSLPLAFVLGNQETMDLPDVGSMSSTHSANPLACVAGKANLEALLEDGLITNSKILGKVLHRNLNQIKARFPKHLAYVEGRGLLAALIFMSEDGEPLTSLCDKISEICLHRGLLVVHTGRESIKLGPPLMISEEALHEGLSVLESAIEDAIGTE